MALIPRGIPLDERETGDAEKRVRLNLEPLVGNFRMAPVALAIATGPHQLQCVFDAAQLVERPGPHLHGEILLELGRGLIGWIGTRLRFNIRYQGGRCISKDPGPLSGQLNP